jgi:hypothetical protein
MMETILKGKSKGMGFSGGWATIALMGLGLGLGLQGCSRESALEAEPQPLSVAARGSAEPVKEIRSLDSLRTMKVTGNYRLMANITMNSWDAVFRPIGHVFDPFRGTFDGNGYTISNLRINAPDGYYQGLFSSTDGAILRRVRLNNVNIKASSVTGAIVGYMINTQLTDSYVTGIVSGSTNTNSYGYALGLAVGTATDRSEIYRCYATGTVTGVTSSIGGFFGEIRSAGQIGSGYEPRAKIQEIFTNVNVNPIKSPNISEVQAGGLAGFAAGVMIQDINCVGPVVGWGPAGGMIGMLVNDDPVYAPSRFTQAITLGKVTSNTYPDRAGLIGRMSGYREGATRCGSVYNRVNDAGTPISLSDIDCNVGLTATELQAAHDDPNKNYRPYIIGAFVDAVFRRYHPEFPTCKLGSGSDGDWMFGTCGETPIIWKSNAGNQYNTLVRIPNPWVQPLY